MPTLTVKIPEEAKTQLAEFVQKLNGEVVSVKNSKAEKKAKLLTGIRAGLEEVKAIQQGKREPLSMADLFRDE